MRRVAIGLAAVLLAAGPALADLPPRQKGRLLRWLQDGAYRQSWTPEPAVHRSLTTAHGLNVRTWYDQTLVEPLAAAVAIDGRPRRRRSRKLLPLVVMIVPRSASLSMRAVASFSSPAKTCGHSLKARFVVTITEPRS